MDRETAQNLAQEWADALEVCWGEDEGIDLSSAPPQLNRRLYAAMRHQLLLWAEQADALVFKVAEPTADDLPYIGAITDSDLLVFRCDRVPVASEEVTITCRRVPIVPEKSLVNVDVKLVQTDFGQHYHYDWTFYLGSGDALKIWALHTHEQRMAQRLSAALGWDWPPDAKVPEVDEEGTDPPQAA